MTNAIGGNIRVSLTLDDMGFTVKTRQAVSSIRELKGDLTGVKGAAEGLETKLGTLGKNVTLTTNHLKSLQSTSRSLENQFASSTKAMTNFNASAQMASQNASLLNGVVLKLAALLDGAVANTNKAAAANTRLAASQKEVSATALATVNGLTAQERAMRNLGQTHRGVAEQAVVAAGLRRNEVVKAAVDEINANNRVMENKQRSLDSLLRAEREFRSKLETERKREQALGWRVENRRDTDTGRMLGANSPLLARYRAEYAEQQRKVASLQTSLNLLGQESERVNSTLGLLRQQNNALNQRIGTESRIEAALARQKQRAEEYLATQRQQAIRQREAVEMTRQQMEMVKGMAQLYGSAKIWQGEKASVNSASEFQRNTIRARAFGLNDAQVAQFNGMAWRNSQENPGVSVTDAQTARIAAMGGLADPKNQAFINQTLSGAIGGAQNVGYLTGDESHESFENTIRNFYGVAEARQVIQDKKKVQDTFDLITKIIAATGNKIDIADLETFLRRIGSQGAANISDEGIMNAVAALDQAKVSGGGGGGGAGGVSTVGTMVKMFQSYANGKTLSNNAVKEIGAAGLLNMDGIDRSKSQKAVFKEMKNAGFNGDGGKFNTDPIGATRDFAMAALGMMQRPENRKRYFGDADINDPEAQRNAMTKFSTRLGMTITASQFLASQADPRVTNRTDMQTAAIKGSLNNDELKKLRLDTYGQQVKNFDAALENLKVSLGTTVLPMMTKFFEGLTKIVEKFNEFGKNNPGVAQFTMIGGALAGLAIGAAGLVRLFGIVGGINTLLRTLTVNAGGAAASAGIMSKAWSASTGVLAMAAKWALSPLALLGGSLTTLATRLGAALVSPAAGAVRALAGVATASTTARVALGALAGPFAILGTRILALGARFAGLGVAATAMATVVGKAFLRMIPYVGWLLLAWDVGKLLLNMEVGFTKVSDYLENWMKGALLKAEEFGIKFRNFFRIGDESNAEGAANLADIKERQAAQDAYFADLKKKNKEFAEAEAKRRAEQKAKEEAEQNAFLTGAGAEHGVPPNKPRDLGAEGADTDVPDPHGDGGKRAPRDQFARQLAQVSSRQEVTAMRIMAAITGRADDLLEQARTEFMEKWKAGDFDPDHDANKRPFKAADGSLDWNAKGASGSVNDWVSARAAMLQQEEQLKALEFANQRVAATAEDAATAMERGTEDTAKQTREMAGLTRELARAEERLKNGTKEFAAWNAKKNEALFQRSRADLVNYAADFTEDDRETANSMIPNNRERIGAKFDIKAQKDLETYNYRLETMRKNYEASRAGAIALGGTVEEQTARMLKLDTEFNDARTKAETAFTEHVKVQANAREYAMRTAIDNMQQEWETSFDRMDEVAASWGNSFVENLSTMLTGGSVSWKSFLAGMLKDLLDLKLKETFAKPMSGMLDSLAGGLTKIFSAKSTPGNTAGTTGAVAGGIGGVLSSAGDTVKGGLKSAASFFGLDKLAGASDAATDAVKSLGTDGAAQATAGLVKNATQAAISAGADANATMSLTAFAMAVQAATAALAAMAASSSGSSAAGILGTALQLGAAAYGSYSGASTAPTGVTSGTGTGFGLGQSLVGPSDVFKFADGGIMSSLGSLPLKKYANGGIADSPQLALFGEGKYREAYVPLPDGRSIPVSFTGGDAGGSSAKGQVIAPVTISITIEKSGSEKTEESGEGDKQQAKDMATRIKNVVREVLLQETRPNGILDKRK